ncbi:O-antigen ligase family protein [Vibrio europaeus]|uniref:O-antigen ligase family protein n=1 Tax=Vibrio europaeus TaxID=300876 RepID=UPI0023405127|nr:O-antigen ligase family protein [Vibrio europaeus]MDC5850461.1 O-antigen ligase family protein [Vibrio europaeus]
MEKPADNVSKILAGSIFLVPALLLSTPNFSVAIILVTFFVSIYCFIKYRDSLHLTQFDLLVVAVMLSYTIANIPVAISDGTTFRYFQGASRLLLCLPIYLLFLQLVRKNGTNYFTYYLSVGVITGSISAFLLAIYQYFYLGEYRVDGFLYSINFGYLACSLVFLSFCLSRVQSRLTSWLYVSFICAVIATSLTLTRGAIFAIPVIFLFCILLDYRKLNIKLISLGLLLTVLGFVGFYNLSTDFKDRVDFTTIEITSIAKGDIETAESTGDRLQYWMAAIEAFKESPYIGLPYKERESLNHELYLNGTIGERASQVSRGHAHNQYFEMLASNGIWGILGFCMLLFVPLTICSVQYLKTQSNWSYTGAVFICGFTVYSLTEVPLQANLISAYYGYMIAVFLAHVSVEKSQKAT